MKRLGLVVAITLIGTTAASAQSIDIGPRGIGVDVDGSDRRIERRERRWDGDREDSVIIRRDRDVRTTGSVRCRTTIVRRENRFGEVVTRRIRECD
jgi:hypothetical protein